VNPEVLDALGILEAFRGVWSGNRGELESFEGLEELVVFEGLVEAFFYSSGIFSDINNIFEV